MKFAKKAVAALFTAAVLLVSNLQAYNEAYYDGPISECGFNDCCDRNLSFTVDFLYWQFRQGFLNDPIRLSTTTTSGVFTESDLKHFRPDFGFDPGVRVGLNYYLQCFCVDFGIIWTHYHTDASKFVNAGANQVIFISSSGPLQSGKVRSQIDLDYVDFDFSRKVCLSPCLSFTPHIGIRGLWFTNKRSEEGLGGPPLVGFNRTFEGRVTNNIRAWGIEGGFWANWNLCRCVSLVGHVGGAILDSRFSTKEASETIETSSTTGAVLGDTTTHNDDVNRTYDQNLNYYIGLQYELCFCGHDILFDIGYEHFSMIEFIQDFNGLTTGVTINY